MGSGSMVHLNRAEQVEKFLQEQCPGLWEVREVGVYNKLFIRLKTNLFLRERKYGRGIPTRYVENYLRMKFKNAPRLLGKIDDKTRD